MERARYNCDGTTIIVMGMPDRRGNRAARDETWVFQHTLERMLFGSNTGSIHRLYERCSLTQASLPLSKSSIEEGLCTGQELSMLIQLLGETLPREPGPGAECDVGSSQPRPRAPL